jgi:hypothetical protein
MKTNKKSSSFKGSASGPIGWTHLSRFKLQYQSRPEDNLTARVFSNGRQQVHIEIILEGRNAYNEVTTIPLDDLRRLELVKYDTGEPLPFQIWVSRSRDIKFDYYPDSGAFPDSYLMSDCATDEHSIDSALGHAHRVSSESAKNARMESITTLSGDGIQNQVYELWISTSSADSLRIAAKLTSSTGIIFHTHSHQVPGGGEVSDGKFNSSFTLSPQMPRRFSADYFNIRQRNEINSENFDVDIYEIWFRDANYRVCDSINHTRPEDQWHYSWNKGRLNHFHVAYKADHLRTVRHFLFGDPSIYIDFNVNYYLASEGRASASRVAELYWKGSFNSGGPARIGYIDNFGNESIISLKPSDDGNTMTIDD